MSSASVGVLGFFRTVLNTAYWEILELFLLPPADQPDLATAALPKVLTPGSETRELDGPENWSDLNPGTNLWAIARRKR